jgi:hypothetical protein
MITLDDNEVRKLLITMALDSDGYQPRTIAVMPSAGDIEFTDEATGEPFDNETVERIYAVARERVYHCDGCGSLKDITEWDTQGHAVNLCADCYAKATA